MRWLMGVLILGLWTSVGMATTATLAWEAPTVGIPVRFSMWRQTQGGPWQRIGSVDAPALFYTDPAPVSGRACYRVTAEDRTHESVPSNTVCLQCSQTRCRER